LSAAATAQVAQSAAHGSALALRLSMAALNQSAANHVMLAHFSNEAILLRGVCAELARQNACLARAFAVQLANNGKPARPQHGR
jgi:hypothetical protein